MKHQAKKPKDQHFKNLELQIQNWRANKGGQRAMPQALWQGAAEIAGKYSVSYVAKQLRLDYKGLKSRVKQAKNRPLPATVAEAEFVELGVSEPIMLCGCEMEIHLTSGANLKIRYPSGAGRVDLNQLWRDTLIRT